MRNFHHVIVPFIWKVEGDIYLLIALLTFDPCERHFTLGRQQKVPKLCHLFCNPQFFTQLSELLVNYCFTLLSQNISSANEVHIPIKLIRYFRIMWDSQVFLILQSIVFFRAFYFFRSNCHSHLSLKTSFFSSLNWFRKSGNSLNRPFRNTSLCVLFCFLS